MPQHTPIAQALRNAYEGHDHDAFKAALARVEKLEHDATHECSRGERCLCTGMPDRSQCLNWGKKRP